MRAEVSVAQGEKKQLEERFRAMRTESRQNEESAAKKKAESAPRHGNCDRPRGYPSSVCFVLFGR